jgi:hypothetical protein
MNRIFRVQLLLILSATFWLALCSAQAVNQKSAEFDRLRNKVDQMDDRDRAFAISIESRLVKLETNLESLSKLIWGVIGAVSLQIIETAWGIVMNWRRSKDT